MKESQIRKKAIQRVIEKGGFSWYPKKVRFHETDVFGIWDILSFYPPSLLVPIQITTLSNISARKRKIKDFYKKHKMEFYCEVWGWDKKKKEFKVVPIYDYVYN